MRVQGNHFPAGSRAKPEPPEAKKSEAGPRIKSGVTMGLTAGRDQEEGGDAFFAEAGACRAAVVAVDVVG